MNLLEPPQPLTARERAIYWAVLIACAASRFLAVAHTLWDWDEALFCLGMRSYDVASHHPHPPGFPVYIAMAKVARLFTISDFRALQTVNLIAAVLLFPAMFMLARELRLRFTTAVIAAALLAFLPNVWFFGGTAFSDVVSIVLVIYAVAFLFRGCRDPKAYLIGAFLLALSVGIRPQNLLVGIFPAAVATWHRTRRDIVLAVLIGIAVVGIAYGAAIRATGSYERFSSAVRAHGEYISKVDSFRSPNRPPLWRIFDRFFVKQYQSSVLGGIVSIFVAVSIIGAIRNRDTSMLYNALTFGPFAVTAWLMLDRFSINRFSIGYAPMFAIFAADGIRRVARQPRIEAAIGGVLVIAFAVWTWPALAVVRREVAPSVAAVDATSQYVDYKRDDLFVSTSMWPFIEYLAPDAQFIRVIDDRALPLSLGTRPAYLLTEVGMTAKGGMVFRRPRGRLWSITRRRYFEVSLAPVSRVAQFVSGWQPGEREGQEEFRAMDGHSVTRLPPSPGDTLLRIDFDVPDESTSTVTIALNGKMLDRFPAAGSQIREYHVTGGAAPGTLEIASSARLRVHHLSWGAE